MDTVINWLWQGGVVAVAASMMLLALRRTSASARCAVCWAASVLVLALPFLPLLRSSSPAAEVFLPTQAEAVVSLPDAWWTSTILLAVAWLLWATIQLARFVSAVVAIRRARARTRAFPVHWQSALPHWRSVCRHGRRATLVLSNSVTSAAVFGWGSPMIAVAPSLVRTLPPEDLDRVLIHEWAHVQRHDDVANVVQIVVRIVVGWHPALWWMDRRLHIEREIACDEIAVGMTGAPKSYAECLMKVSAVPRTPMAMLMAPAVFASSLRARIVKIVSPHRLIAPLGSRGLAAAIVLILCCVAAAVGRRTIVDAAAVALPIVSARIQTLDVRSGPSVPEAVTAEDAQTARPARRAPDRSSSYQRAQIEQPLPPPQTAPFVESVTPSPSVETNRHEPPAVAEPIPGPPPTPVPEVASVQETETAPPLPDASALQPRSPWSAAAASGVALGRTSQDAGAAIGRTSQDAGAAIGRTSQDAGVAIGRTSKDAGVATAGFFTKFARRVAGSF